METNPSSIQETLLILQFRERLSGGFFKQYASMCKQRGRQNSTHVEFVRKTLSLSKFYVYHEVVLKMMACQLIYYRCITSKVLYIEALSPKCFMISDCNWERGVRCLITLSPVSIIVKVIFEKAFNSFSHVGLLVAFLGFSRCNPTSFSSLLAKEWRTTNSTRVCTLTPIIRRCVIPLTWSSLLT